VLYKGGDGGGNYLWDIGIPRIESRIMNFNENIILSKKAGERGSFVEMEFFEAEFGTGYSPGFHCGWVCHRLMVLGSK